jgi:hypothetical protein
VSRAIKAFSGLKTKCDTRLGGVGIELELHSFI